ncbi:sensor histidine kinase [Longimicrobium terrae]|uniref:Two-component system sensor histidine kinase DesK n=1 Tax=Longimicrobium terrae TaxID=1639882 RepID=A0A841H2A9_9BACT|nr:sensor histidine kinase [Longimicrobium terrae]MBB4637920.1 two-component system sensor histidine kinase DesK [Longimicrobium terrae]MBB6072167.1 two-component system sensor histidine kinase DesK [Longimicrobium terrae]NNC28406.1 sensor histidine kinase [Longimicrobium terrae]
MNVDSPSRGRRLLPPGDDVGWTAYVWLIYLSFLLVDPVHHLRTGTLTAGAAVATVAALVVFLASYFRGFWVAGRDLLLVVAVQVALGVVMAPGNSGASVFLIFAASFAGRLERTRLAAATIAGIALIGGTASWMLQAPIWYWSSSVLMPLVIGSVNLHHAQAAKANAKLQMAQEQIEHLAAVAERERIGRDLHDLLGHTLSLIVLKSELAAKLSTRDPERAGQEIREVEQVARKALREVREAIRGYRASLADEVRQSEAILSAAGIRARIEVAPVELEREVEESLALALREAVTNVVRHSGAAACGVRLYAEGGECVLEVADDGRAGMVTEGNGLRGMRERIASVGGTTRGGNGPDGGGMRIIVRVPARPGPGVEARPRAVAVPA